MTSAATTGELIDRLSKILRDAGVEILSNEVPYDQLVKGQVSVLRIHDGRAIVASHSILTNRDGTQEPAVWIDSMPWDILLYCCQRNKWSVSFSIEWYDQLRKSSAAQAQGTPSVQAD